MNSPIFNGQFKDLGDDVEAMARDLRISVSDILRVGASRLLSEWQRTGSIVLGTGQPPDFEPLSSRSLRKHGREHPLFGTEGRRGKR
jgi:hypothetical protein